MQTSTPSNSSKRRGPKDIGVLNLSPVSKTENETASKGFSRRKRKPKKWEDFETESSFKHQKNERQSSSMASETSTLSSNVTKRGDIELESGKILLEERDTCVSVSKTDLVKNEPVNIDMNLKGKSKTQKRRNNHVEESSIKNESSGTTGRVVKDKKSASQNSGEKNRLSDEKQLLPHKRIGKAECSSRDSNVDDTDDIDVRLAANTYEIAKLRDAVESRRTTKYIDKSERLMKSESEHTLEAESKNFESIAGAGRKLMRDISSDTFENETKLQKDEYVRQKNKDAAIKGRNHSRPKKSVIEENISFSKNSSQEFDKSVITSCPVEKFELEIDESINTTSNCKTPVRKRGRKKVNEEINDVSPHESGHKNSSGDNSETRRMVNTKSLLDLKNRSTHETVNVLQNSTRGSRKRKRINYADLDNGDQAAEREDKAARTRLEKELANDQEIDDSLNNGSVFIEKKTISKRTEKKGQYYKCHHCEYKGKGVPDIRKHYAVNHQLWWSENFPEGNSDRASLTKIIKIKKVLNCTKCDKQINFVTYYHNHLEWCGRENVTYTCNYCNKEGLMLRWQNFHLKTCSGLVVQTLEEKRRKQIEEQDDCDEEETSGRGKTRKAAKKAMSIVHNISKEMEPSAYSDQSDNDPDAEISEEDDENDDEDDIDDDEINEYENISSPDEGDGEDIVDFDEDTGEPSNGGYGGRTSIYYNPFPEMEDFVKENWSQELFLDWLPWKQDWQQLSQEKSEPYLPKQKTSMRFCFGQEKTPVTLEHLQSKHINGSPIIYTGLNVWQIAWCPMSLKCTDVQYLAVTGKVRPSKPFLTDERSAGSGLIQIWNTGIFSNKCETRTLPKLVYNMVHDYGLVTQMVWCHSGCYKSNHNQANRDSFTRLGLLAVSFTDGTCRIFSVPVMKAAGDGPAPTYHAKPVVTLAPYNKYEEHDITCSCVDWIKSSGHSKVITGYSNGAVRLFNLSCKSPLQYLSTNEGLKLLPYINLQPHGNLVRAVSFCSTLDSAIVTSSEDFETYFWDLNNLGAPLHDDGGFYMAMCFCTSVFQHGVYLGCDDNYAFLTNKARYIESGHLMYCGKPERRKEERSPYYISSQPSCIWDIQCSDWTGFAAASDNRGYISGLLLKDLMKILPDCKSYRYRQVLLETSIQETSDDKDDKRNERKNINQSNKLYKCNCHETTRPDTHLNGTGDIGEQTCCSGCKMKCSKLIKECQTVHAADLSESGQNKESQMLASRAVLQFEEHHKVAKYCPQDKHSDTYNRPSMTAIKSLSLNPNQLQCCWLAYGGNSGLFRLINLQKMLAVTTQAYMKTNKYL